MFFLDPSTTDMFDFMILYLVYLLIPQKVVYYFLFDNHLCNLYIICLYHICLSPYSLCYYHELYLILFLNLVHHYQVDIITYLPPHQSSARYHLPHLNRLGFVEQYAVILNLLSNQIFQMNIISNYYFFNILYY